MNLPIEEMTVTVELQFKVKYIRHDAKPGRGLAGCGGPLIPAEPEHVEVISAEHVTISGWGQEPVTLTEGMQSIVRYEIEDELDIL